MTARCVCRMRWGSWELDRACGVLVLTRGTNSTVFALSVLGDEPTIEAEFARLADKTWTTRHDLDDLDAALLELAASGSVGWTATTLRA